MAITFALPGLCGFPTRIQGLAHPGYRLPPLPGLETDADLADVLPRCRSGFASTTAPALHRVASMGSDRARDTSILISSGSATPIGGRGAGYRWRETDAATCTCWTALKR